MDETSQATVGGGGSAVPSARTADPSSSWAAALVGLPWRPDRNCWWLVQHCQLVAWGRRMPDLEIGLAPVDGADHASLEQRRAALVELLRHSPWRRVPIPAQAGDVLVVQGARGPHVGVLLDAERVLHNPGGMVDGRPQGSVVVTRLADMGLHGFGRPELWRHCAW